VSNDITRRDFIHDVSLSSLGMLVPLGGWAQLHAEGYPPVLTGMRGSHLGSFEVAHALAREGRSFEPTRDTGEQFDLVVVGGGISGLASAWYYRKLFGPDSRILIIENHDDFGGHAKRNEFHQGGLMRLAWGGVMDLRYPLFSDTAKTLLKELGINTQRLRRDLNFNYGGDGALGPAVYFDAETYGRDVLIPGLSLRQSDFESIQQKIDEIPLDQESRDSLKSFYSARTDVLAGLGATERSQYLKQTSYIEFLRTKGGLTEAAAALFMKALDGDWGLSLDSLSVAEALSAGMSGIHLLGKKPEASEYDYEFAMFPDGNSSVARLLVRRMIPAVAPGDSMDDIVTAKFDYSQLDRPDSNVRIRLSATAVHVQDGAGGAVVNFVKNGEVSRVHGRHVVLACWHAIIPYIFPALPDRQAEAMRYQVKRPLLVTNVLIRHARAFDRLGVTGAYCPGGLHGSMWLIGGVNVGEYRRDWSDDGPAVVQFFGRPGAPARGLTARQQHRADRARLLEMEFSEFEREVRSVLDGMLGAGGFDAAEDILAITVNRWSHGYSYDYLDLWDPDWPPGEAPHEIARQRFGNIAIANADAGANAYTHVAIDEAWRAVNELRATVAA